MKYLKPKEVAESDDNPLTLAQLYVMIRAGRIPHFRPGGKPTGNVLIPDEVLEDFLSGRKIDPAWLSGRLPGEVAAPKSERVA